MATFRMMSQTPFESRVLSSSREYRTFTLPQSATNFHMIPITTEVDDSVLRRNEQPHSHASRISGEVS
jgi:hypothetical protein